jgi:hypothetical protein
MIDLAWRELTAGRITKREQMAINDRAITEYNLGPVGPGPGGASNKSLPMALHRNNRVVGCNEP